MSAPTDWEIVQAMEQFGGSFVKALAVLCHRADPVNFAKIKATFAEEWADYIELAKRAKERDAAAR